jgi:hypothetical protein
LKGRLLRSWIEIALALVSGGLLILTLFSREWIEILFGVDPDAGTGALEWTVTAVLLVLTVATTAAARDDWRHARGVSQG